MSTYRPCMVKRSCFVKWLVADAACSMNEGRVWRMKFDEMSTAAAAHRKVCQVYRENAIETKTYVVYDFFNLEKETETAKINIGVESHHTLEKKILTIP
ncbi:hypothetical protein TNCV_3934511 [Trichonephila clavipes]|nr:hypothetical protein TNCV_3934511 [Trichonephila clavipes]